MRWWQESVFLGGARRSGRRPHYKPDGSEPDRPRLAPPERCHAAPPGSGPISGGPDPRVKKKDGVAQIGAGWPPGGPRRPLRLAGGVAGSAVG